MKEERLGKMKEIESESGNYSKDTETRSTQKDVNGMLEIKQNKQENKMSVALKGYPIVVSEKQFEIVREEQLASLNYLNSSSDVLLSAMKSMVPPEGSGRVVGEYTAQGIRQIAKSICDVIHTKSSVVRQMYAISRDEL